MYSVKYASLIMLAMAWLVAAPLQAALSSKPDNTVIAQPRADLAAEDVVGIVINALAKNDQPFPDAGIATTFAFASPGNKANTGPLEKFTRMVKSHPYAVMVNHVASDFSEVVRVGDDAYQLVALTGLDGSGVVFAFRLSRQLDGEFEGMWMTDAVWPVSDAGMPKQAL
jgi:hypothetical protein